MHVSQVSGIYRHACTDVDVNTLLIMMVSLSGMQHDCLLGRPVHV